MQIKHLILCILCLAINKSFAQYNFHINLSTSKHAGGVKMYMAILGNDKRTVIKRDSALVTDSGIKFTGSISQTSNFVNFYIKNGKNYSTKMMVVDTGRNDFIIESLPQKNDPNSYLMIKAVNSRSNNIQFSLDSIQEYYYQLHSVKDKASGISTLSKASQLELNKNQINFLKKYLNDYITLISLYEISNYHRGETYTNLILDSFNSLNPNLKHSTFGKTFFEEKTDYLKNIKNVHVGNQVPKFKVKDFKGNYFENETLKGQNYIIVFSATWCLPCQKELPDLIKLYNTYKAKGLKVVYFNQDDNIVNWANHVTKNKLTWINVSERLKSNQSTISKRFNIYEIPTYFLINKNGTIIYNSVDSNLGLIGLQDTIVDLYKN